MDFPALERHLRALDHLFIDLNRLRNEDEYVITPAGFSVVVVCTLDPGTPRSTLVAAKRLTAPTSFEFEFRRLAVRLAREVRVWAALQHPHVLPLLGFHLGQDDGAAILISEYQVNGNLVEYLEEENPSWAIRLQLVHDLTEGLLYLHEQNPPIIHGDFKPANILISAQGKAMLCDFGLSKFLEVPTGLTTTASVRGTLRYQSPEMVLDGSSPSLSSDVWAWACLALVALTDTSPYDQAKTDFGMIDAMMKGKPPAAVQSLRIPVPPLKQLLTHCWNFELDARPSVAHCLRIIDSALAMVSDLPELDFNLPEKHLQHLQHLLIDISRLKEDMEFASKHIHVRICTLDPGNPASKLVIARTVHFMPERKRTRLASRFARELGVWATLRHPHILPVLGGYLDRKCKAAVFIFEYQAGGDLKEFLEQEKPAWATRLQLVRDTMDGLAYLHGRSPPLGHGDLNMGNILLSADQKAMLVDFGPSKPPDDSPAELSSDGLNTAVRYRSPELADKQGNGGYDLPCDIWAWGCLALETLTDTLPYADEVAPPAILDAILNGKPPAQVENLIIPVPELRLLLSRCWAFEPQDRPSARSCRHILDSALDIRPTPAETLLTPLESCLQKFKYLRLDITRLKEEIGYPDMKGGYAQIRVCTLDPGTPTSKLVVSKKLHFDPEWKPGRLACRFARELRVWAVLQHPHILPLLGFYLDQDHKTAIFIAEYQAQGDLSEYIREKKPTWDIRLQLVRDLTDGLVYLHEQTPPIRHGDLKTGNVFISAQRKAMLADFGISKSLENGPTGLSSDGRDATLRYCSPELANEKGSAWSELASDIWAWGCLALEALTDTVPYADKATRQGLLTAILRGHPPARVEDLPIPIPDIKLLLARCWDSEPEARPPAAECLDALSSAIL